MLNTILRAGDVLSLFTEDRPNWGVREVASALEIPRSNAHELMSSLASIGLLRRTPDSRYELGWRLLTLSGNLASSTPVARLGNAVLNQLAMQNRETALLSSWTEGRVVSIGQARAPGGVPVGRIGEQTPAHSTAGGKVLLAHLGLDPGSQLERFTPNTVTDPEMLRRQLAVVRRGMPAFDRRETDDGIACVASPVREGETGPVVAALCLCLPPAKFDRYQDHFRKSVTGAARRMTIALGLHGSAGPRTDSATA